MTRSPDLVEALDEHAIPLSTTDPDADLADLQPLVETFEGVEVVGLGEATHGTREFFQLKHRLVRLLVEELGFRLFGLEANFSETLAIDEYVVHGEGDPRDALDGIYFWTWDTKEVLAMIEWMRAFNDGRQEGDRVRFYGFDAQFTAGPARALEDYLGTVDPEVLDEHEATLAMLADEGLDENGGLDANEDGEDDEAAVEARFEHAEQLVAALFNRFEERETAYVEASSRNAYDLAVRHLRVLDQALGVRRAQRDDDAETLIRRRDRAMAENASWILDHERHDRVALWAHNEHVKRGTMDGDWGEADAMGDHLGREYGDRYHALGFDFARGSFQAKVEDDDGNRDLRECSVGDPPSESVAGRFRSLDESLYFLDVADAAADQLAGWLADEQSLRSVGAIYGDEDESYWTDEVLSEAFDGLLYVEETSRAVPVERQDCD